MRLLMILAVLSLIGASFALSDAVKQCVRGCCEDSGGTYLAESNGCANPGNGSYECSMACQKLEQKPAGICPGAILALGFVGSIFIFSPKRNRMY